MAPERAAAALALRDARFDTYWLDSLVPLQDEAALAHDIECDLLIVGGGFCGLWAAIQAKERQPQRPVVLIEAKSIGNGASGRPAAILSTSVMHGIENTERQFPDDVAALEQLGRENMDGFRRTLERYGIDCDIEWSGEMMVAVSASDLDAIDREHALYCKYGHHAVRLDRSAVQAEIHSPQFHAGVWSQRRSGTVHPGKLVHALKRIALQLGVQVYENTPLRRTRLRADRVLVDTPHGTIDAASVLLATNAWAAGDRRISQRVAAIRDRIVVTEPLTPEQMDSVGWRNRQGVYDTRTQLNYMRLTRDDRILFGGRLDYFFGNDTDPAQDRTAQPYLRLVEAFHRTFPQLEGRVRIAYAWSGPIGLSARMAVHYQRFHGGRMVFAGGYSGFGVTASRFGARVGLELLDGLDTPESRMAFALTVPGYIPPEPFRWLGAKITMHALDTLDEKGGWRKPWIGLLQRMGFPLTL